MGYSEADWVLGEQRRELLAGTVEELFTRVYTDRHGSGSGPSLHPEDTSYDVHSGSDLRVSAEYMWVIGGAAGAEALGGMVDCWPDLA